MRWEEAIDVLSQCACVFVDNKSQSVELFVDEHFPISIERFGHDFLLMKGRISEKIKNENDSKLKQALKENLCQIEKGNDVLFIENLSNSLQLGRLLELRQLFFDKLVCELEDFLKNLESWVNKFSAVYQGSESSYGRGKFSF